VLEAPLLSVTASPRNPAMSRRVTTAIPEVVAVQESAISINREQPVPR
jgi:hypothetical protein